MNRYILAAAAVSAVCCLVSCSGKGGDSTDASAPAPAVTTEAATEAETTSAAVTTASKQTTSSAVTAVTTTAAAQPGVFRYDEGGAIKFDAPAASQDDSTLMEAAQALFESACAVEWDFTVGSPYTLDTSEYITGQYDWQYFLVASPGINSMADVRADYHKVFSSRYPDELDNIFMEKDGNVYSLNGARGKDIFYSYSLITSIDKRTDDEVFFTVTNYYTGSAKAPDTPCTEEEEFSAVIDPDGTFRAGKFRLPY